MILVGAHSKWIEDKTVKCYICNNNRTFTFHFTTHGLPEILYVIKYLRGKLYTYTACQQYSLCRETFKFSYDCLFRVLIMKLENFSDKTLTVSKSLHINLNVFFLECFVIYRTSVTQWVFVHWILNQLFCQTLWYPACQITTISCSFQWSGREGSADIQSFHEEFKCWYNKNTCITLSVTTPNYITLHY